MRKQQVHAGGLHATPCQKCSQLFSAALHVATGRKGAQQNRCPHLVHSESMPCWQKKAKPHTAQRFQGAGCKAHTARTCHQPTWTACSWLVTCRQATLAVQRGTTRKLPPPPRTTQRKPHPQTCAHMHMPTGNQCQILQQVHGASCCRLCLLAIQTLPELSQRHTNPGRGGVHSFTHTRSHN